MTDFDDIDPVYSYCRKRFLVMGAGNPLYGDDGFGPEVIKELERRDIPDDIHLMDVETSARNFIFNILISEVTPRAVIIVDSMSKGRGPGEVYEVDLDDLPTEKSDDFQFHFTATSNMLRELWTERGIRIVIIGCEAAYIPEVNMEMGLSEPVRAAVPVAADMVLRRAAELREELGGGEGTGPPPKS